MLKKICGHTFIGDKLRKDSIVVDLGANKGEFTEKISKKYRCAVYAIEPIPELFTAIKKTENVVAMQGAITGKDEIETIYVPEDRCATLLRGGPSERAIEVQGYTIGRFLSINGIGNIDLMKVDIEGAEIDLFKALSKDDLQKIVQCTVEFHDFLYPDLKDEVEEMKKKLVSAGFYCIPFSLNNGDVLFVRRDRLSFARFIFLRFVWRYVKGIGRRIVTLLFKR